MDEKNQGAHAVYLVGPAKDEQQGKGGDMVDEHLPELLQNKRT